MPEDTDLPAAAATIAAIERFVSSPAPGAFEDLALRAFAFQFERVEPYRNWCSRAGRTPETVTHWRDVPCVPTRAFKTVALHAAPPLVTFTSSGTTAGEKRSLHHHPFPALYRRVIETSFPSFCLPRGGRPPMLSLVPPFAPTAESSLSFMVDHVLATLGGEGSVNAVGARGVDLTRARSWLAARQRDARAYLVLTTALALEQCLRGLERLDLRFRAPLGSAVFLTGGFKTRQGELSLDDLMTRLADRLAVQPGAVVEEYGMTELTSQAYTRTLLGGPPGLFVCPPWMRARVLDPASLQEAAPGREGLLALFDLANVGSALHVLTEDLARIDEGGFRLLGRASGADLRGCSLTAEELAAGGA